jgi:hypothetical protein
VREFCLITDHSHGPGIIKMHLVDRREVLKYSPESKSRLLRPLGLCNWTRDYIAVDTKEYHRAIMWEKSPKYSYVLIKMHIFGHVGTKEKTARQSRCNYSSFFEMYDMNEMSTEYIIKGE